MKAVLCHAWGEPESLVIGDAPHRALQQHEVRIRVSACGVNFADPLQVAGKYQVKPRFPFNLPRVLPREQGAHGGGDVSEREGAGDQGFRWPASHHVSSSARPALIISG